jgi:DDE domain
MRRTELVIDASASSMTAGIARTAGPAARDHQSLRVALLPLRVSLRDVSELMLARGIEVSHEAIRLWTLRFGTEYARRLRRSRGACSNVWHLDELCLMINGERGWLWRAVDDAGEVLDILVQRRRSARAARRFYGARVAVAWGIVAMRLAQPIILVKLAANIAGVVFIVASMHLSLTDFAPRIQSGAAAH